MASTLPADVLGALRRIGLPEPPGAAPLAGGVSSDIWRVDFRTGAVCAKRALPRLAVAALWEAGSPPSRSTAASRWPPRTSAA